MDLKLITEHKDYLLLVDTRDDYKIDPFDWYLKKHPSLQPIMATSKGWDIWDIIIAHLPLNNAPKLEGVPYLPCPYPEKNCVSKELCKSKGHCVHPFAELSKQEEDVEQLAENIFKAKEFTVFATIAQGRSLLKKGWIEGYKAASKKWSDEDIINAFKAGSSRVRQKSLNSPPLRPSWKMEFKSGEEYLQSLSPKLTPIGFEPELIEDPDYANQGFKGVIMPKSLKIIEGVLQGTYKF